MQLFIICWNVPSSNLNEFSKIFGECTIFLWVAIRVVCNDWILVVLIILTLHHLYIL